MPTPIMVETPFGKGAGPIQIFQEFGEGASDPAHNDHGNPDPAHPADIYLYYAIDFGLSAGTPVLAQGDGTVIDFRMTTDNDSQGPPDGFGNYVTVKYTNPSGGFFYATYMHLSRQSSTPTVVHQGDVIALSGDTGTFFSGRFHPHLHVTFGLVPVLYHSAGDASQGLPADILMADGSQAKNGSTPPIIFSATVITPAHAGEALNGLLHDGDTIFGDGGPALHSSKLYVVDDRGRLFSVNTISLNATLIGDMGQVLTDISLAPDGTLYGISFSDLYRVDKSNGHLTLVGSLGVFAANAFEIDATGHGYIAEGSSDNFYSVNLATGATSVLGHLGDRSGAAGDIVFHDGAAYVSMLSNNIVRVDLSTGNGVSEHPDGLDNLYGLAELNGATYAFAGKTMYAIDVTTGATRSLHNLSASGVGNIYGAATDEFVQTPTSTVLNAAYASILRSTLNTSADVSALATLENAVASGAKSEFQAIQDLVHQAAATTTVATLAYQFFTGVIPTAAGYDFLVSLTGPNPNNLSSSYYQSFNLENRYINFAVNLGKNGAGSASFTAHYGALSLFEATRQAYASIFGDTPSDTKLHALLDPTLTLNGQALTRADYFALYGGDGASGVGTKAAMVGWLLAEAVKADLGTFALSSDAFLTDLVKGAAYNVDLIGVYARPEYVFHPG